jgi:acetyltransferase-like isoleucine patch superfamily enzyme
MSLKTGIYLFVLSDIVRRRKSTSDIRIAELAYVGPQCVITHDNIVGRYSQLSGNVCLGGRVVVEDSVFVGLSVTVIPGVKLGTKCHIGAGSVVLKNVKPLYKVFGNPGKVIGEVEEASPLK